MSGSVRGTGRAAVRTTRRRLLTPCVTVRQDLCRLAVGAPAALGAARMAAHARRCPACAAFADDVARVRGWLAAPPGAQAALAQAGWAQAACARAALVRELAARIARDLLARAGVAPARPAVECRADRARLLALLGRRGLRQPPWRDALRRPRAADAAGPVVHAERERLLAAALRLDPLGLDVVLGHLAQLERNGKHERADGHADSVLSRLA